MLIVAIVLAIILQCNVYVAIASLTKTHKHNWREKQQHTCCIIINTWIYARDILTVNIGAQNNYIIIIRFHSSSSHLLIKRLWSVDARSVQANEQLNRQSDVRTPFYVLAIKIASYREPVQQSSFFPFEIDCMNHFDWTIFIWFFFSSLNFIHGKSLTTFVLMLNKLPFVS